MELTFKFIREVWQNGIADADFDHFKSVAQQLLNEDDLNEASPLASVFSTFILYLLGLL
jgi:hypothetical protein